MPHRFDFRGETGLSSFYSILANIHQHPRHQVKPRHNRIDLDVLVTRVVAGPCESKALHFVLAGAGCMEKSNPAPLLFTSLVVSLAGTALKRMLTISTAHCQSHLNVADICHELVAPKSGY
jgi:hypothetical protein